MRLLVLLLLFANGLYFAWSQGLLLPYGFGPALQSEPQRLGQQLRAQSLQLLSDDAFKRMEEQVRQEQSTQECLQAGPLDTLQSDAVRQALQQSGLPSEAWSLEETALPARWIVYMGKYGSAEMLAKKRAEVQAMNLKPEALNNASLEPGFSLGGFGSKADADAELLRLNGRGLHTARVVQERTAGTAQVLRLPALTSAQSARLADVRNALGGTVLHTCN